MTFRPQFVPSVQIQSIELELNENIINFEAFNQEFVAQFQKRLKKIAYEGKDFWSSEAGKRLNTTREAYQASLAVQDKGDGSYTISVAGKGGKGTKDQRWLALALEDGIPSYDMKPGLLGNRPIRRIRLADGNFRMVHPAQVGKWIHPGFQGLKIQDIVADHVATVLVPKITEEAFDAAVKKLHTPKGKKK
ncbi:MAG: hypothetical protein JWO15_3693 [Sphingomonadales bacterium]|nr:hypothetical protein [Sphingomonadales bacterium]